MPPRRAKESGIPAVNSPILFDYSEQLAILLFGQLMKWLHAMVRRGDSIPLADLKDALWAVKEAWELYRDIARASGPQSLSAVPAEELDALTAGYPLIEARDLSVADKRRLQAASPLSYRLRNREAVPAEGPSVIIDERRRGRPLVDRNLPLLTAPRMVSGCLVQTNGFGLPLVSAI